MPSPGLNWSRILGAIFILAPQLLGCISGALAQEIWFTPPDHLPRFGQVMNEDFPRLFDLPSQWPAASSRVSVFGFNPYFEAGGPVDLTQRALTFLKHHRIGINLTLDALPTETCGRGVEGMVRTPDEPAGVARRMRELGVSDPYVSLDEPLTFGKLYREHDACGFGVQEVARRLARTVRKVREVYPTARFVDYEVPNGTGISRSTWSSILREWLAAYRKETTEQIDAVILDVQWSPGWPEAVRDSVEILHAEGIRAGIFLTAPGGPAVTDAIWIEHLKRNVLELREAQLKLDIVQFATWVRHPWRMLPETDPLALTSVINWYFEHRAVSK